MSRRTHPGKQFRTPHTAIAVAAIIGSLAGAQATLAQDSGSVPVDVGECVDLESALERFACYEDRVAEARRDRAEAAPPAEAREARPDAGARSAREPDAALPAAAARPPAQQSGAAADGAGMPNEFVATVASLRETVPNSLMITLNNGQVWRQMRPRPYPLRPGQQVRLYSTNWGPAYRLTADELNGFIQVERAR